MFKITIKILFLTLIVSTVGAVSDVFLGFDKPCMYSIGFVVGIFSFRLLNKLADYLFKISRFD